MVVSDSVLIQPNEPISPPEEVNQVDFDEKVLIQAPESVSDLEEIKKVDTIETVIINPI